ncbi:hypothetical protein DFH11DRAFT_1728691 [Phellopilus nigrolimitatus]|nr:hypothetical protein DFH11DRAFT_1728691 [Phellopilus nigrolimitatus]
MQICPQEEKVDEPIWSLEIADKAEAHDFSRANGTIPELLHRQSTDESLSLDHARNSGYLPLTLQGGILERANLRIRSSESQEKPHGAFAAYPRRQARQGKDELEDVVDDVSTGDCRPRTRSSTVQAAEPRMAASDFDNVSTTSAAGRQGEVVKVDDLDDLEVIEVLTNQGGGHLDLASRQHYLRPRRASPAPRAWLPAWGGRAETRHPPPNPPSHVPPVRRALHSSLPSAPFPPPPVARTRMKPAAAAATVAATADAARFPDPSAPFRPLLAPAPPRRMQDACPSRGPRAPTPPPKDEPLGDEHAPALGGEDRHAASAQSDEGVQV